MSDQDPIEASEDFTRRQWLLKLGQLIAVAGFSGAVPEFAAGVSAADQQQNMELPPGLYGPSQQHLGQVLGEAGSMHAAPPGSETDYVQPSSGPFNPQFFSDEEFRIVTRFVEVLVGEVDSGSLSQTVQWLDLYLHSAAAVRDAALSLDPLHRALAVAYYGETAVRELEAADPQTVVRSGIAALQKLSNGKYGEGFLEIGESQQTDLVTGIWTTQPDSSLRKFFETTRAEIIRGYYTSAQGLRELDYKGNWYYTVCPGCEQKT